MVSSSDREADQKSLSQRLGYREMVCYYAMLQNAKTHNL